MQIFALNDDNIRVSAYSALRGKNYFCLECKGKVRLRGGSHRQTHFYHYTSSSKCRQNGKSPTHLALQIAMSEALPTGEAFLEEPFPEIKRIADIAWHSKKLIFEIQCSPLSAEEVANRISDYSSLNYRVVWVLHDRTFNKYRVSGAEHFLKNLPRFYTNFNDKGQGMIYDQHSVISLGTRFHRSSPLPVYLHKLYESMPTQFTPKKLPPFLEERYKNWSFFFEGDLFDRMLRGQLSKEFFFFPSKKRETWQKRVIAFLVLPYRSFMAWMLEKTCD